MKITKYSLAIVFLVGVALALTAWVYLQLGSREVVVWDEANYIWMSHPYYQALGSGDWERLLNLVETSVSYPFLQGLYFGIVGQLFGFTIASFRLASALLLIPSVLIILLICRELDKQSILFLFLTSFLLLTSPHIPQIYSMTLREGIGTLFTYLTVLIYLIARRRNRQSTFSLAGLSLTAVFFVKTHYGLIVLAAIGIDSLLWLFSLKSKSFQKYLGMQFAFFLPLFMINGYWLFMVPGNLAGVIGFLKNMDDSHPNMRNHLLFYLFHLANSYTISYLVFALVSIGFVTALFKYSKDYRLRLIAFVFLVNLLYMIPKVGKNQPRYLFTSIPALLIVSSYGLTKIWENLNKRRSFLVAAVILAIVFLVGPELRTWGSKVKSTGSWDIGSRLFYETDGDLMVRLSFDKSKWPTKIPQTNYETIDDVMHYIFSTVDISKGITQVGTANEFSPSLFNLYMTDAKSKNISGKKTNFSNFYVTFWAKPDGKLETQDYEIFNRIPSEAGIKSIEADPQLKLISQREFADLGVIVKIYAK